jgi:hypothetical protein
MLQTNIFPRVIKSTDVQIQQEEAAMPLWTRQSHPSRTPHQRKEVSQSLQFPRLQMPRLPAGKEVASLPTADFLEGESSIATILGGC